MLRHTTYTLAYMTAALMATTSPAALAQNAVKPAAVEEIVVTGVRTREKARTVQKIAPNLVNIQSAEEIAKYPDFNAAEALGRIPGLSLSADTGEGRFVNVRGLDANLNGATFDGVVLLNTFPGGTAASGSGRAVEFDTVPSGLIDRIIVTKTGLPDHEAEGIGGSIELVPRTAAGLSSKYLFEGTLGGSYENLRKSGGFRGEGTAAYKFGLGGDGTGFFSNKEPLTIILSGAYNEDRRNVDDQEPSYNTGEPDRTIATTDLRYYKYNRRRFGYGGDIEYKPNSDHQIFFRFNEAGYRESVYRQILTPTYNIAGAIDSSGNPLSPTNIIVGTFPGSGLDKSNRLQQETHRNTLYEFGGKSRFSEIVVDYRAGYSTATYIKPYDLNSDFVNPNLVTASYDSTNPDRILFTTSNPASDLAASNYVLSSFRNSSERDADKEWTGHVDISIPIQLASADGTLKFGGQLRLREKTTSLISTKYNLGTFAPTLDQFDYAQQVTFYDGLYQLGNPINNFALTKAISNNPAVTTSVNQNFSTRGNIDDSENIYAGYGQYSAKLGDVGVLAGVRVENTSAVYRGFTQPVQSGPFVPTSASRKYTDVFPTVQFRYEFTPELIGRATYSTGIARPGFFQVTSTQQVDYGNQRVTAGNPNLKPTKSNNFDVSVEYYLPKNGIISLGFFDKQFSNYVLPLTDNRLFDFGSGLVAANRYTTYNNASSAHALGVEFNYDQRFAFLPAPFDGVGLTGNFTYVDSSGKLTKTSTAGRLPGTSEFTYNAALYYEAHNIEARLSVTHVSSSFFDFGTVVQSARTQIDWTSAYDLTNHFTVYFNAKNLNNSPLRYSTTSFAFVTQREFYQQTFEAGLRFKFK